MKTLTIFRRLIFWILLPSVALAGTLADTPLSLKSGVPPNVMFALSVEYPTANTAAYQDTASYDFNNEYLGYFDPDKCYDYDSTNGWFYPIVTSHPDIHKCAIRWSGNLLNWASMTGLDEFRFAMTGGNRYQDTSTLTVLERSYQSGQGGTGNFPDKTFVESDGFATTYPAGTSLKFQNQGRGVQMLVTPGGTNVANCTNPTLVGASFSCTLSLESDGSTASCNTWGGSGTSASPYTCTSFGAFPVIGTPSSATAVTPPGTFTAGGGTSDTVSCSTPTMTGSNFTCGTLALSGGHTGTCSGSYSGAGTSISPFKCTTFGTFSGGESFATSSASPTVSTFSVTTPGTPQTYPSSGYTTCSVSGSGSSTTITCTLGNGHTASCSQASFSGSGTNSSPYYCRTFGFPFGETNNANPQARSSTKTVVSSKTYYLNYQISYLDIPTTTTYSYVSSYPGSISGITTYYTTRYNLTFSTSQTFNVRVKVCDSISATIAGTVAVGPENNCVQYGSAYKPNGVVQNNGDKMRFGVTSYFQSNDIDNAVLRSKLKYVAPLMYSPSGGATTNARTEWSATDGTLFQNPDSSDTATANSFIGTTANSGVINYINKFGSASHTYKTYDDMGKLYYETLKYLRGGPPTTDLYRGATAANSDGFPIVTTWDDPIQFSCQKNYIIAMGDTHTWCDKRLPGASNAAANNGVCNAYTDSNGNSHAADFGGTLGTDSGVNVATVTNNVGTLEGLGNIATSYTGAGSSAGYGMAGLASWAASSDIRPGTAANVVGKQSVTSYVIDVLENKDCGYQSQYWLAAKYGNPASYDANGTWISQSLQSGSQQWWSTQALPAGLCSSRSPAAALGNPAYSATGGSVTWPKNLLRAGDPLSMITSVQNAISAIIAQIGDEAALAQSSGHLDTGTGAYLYRSLYNSGGWRGNLQAFVIDTNGNVSSTPSWSASAKLPSDSARNIFTFNNGLKADGTSETVGNVSRKGATFNAANFANLSSGQQARLNADQFGITDGLGVDRVNYVRGDQTKEVFAPPGSTTPNPLANNSWRARQPWPGESRFTLGDLVNSNPAFVGAPSMNIPDPSYKTFARNLRDRVPMVYVGANDGMLHAFDASFTYATTGLPAATSTSGTEMFAYVPSSVYSNLSQLMSPNYVHKYFVDGSPVVSDACSFSCPTDGSGWKTVLVGTLKAGGQGIFALDVTNPITTSGGVNSNNFSASNVLWEFTDADDSDLGYTFSTPVVGKLKDGHWAVVFGNGFNNTTSDTHSSTTGRAYLFVLYIDGPGVDSVTGAGKPWVLGTNYFKIELKSPSESVTATLPLSPPNGLASIAVLDKDFDGAIDYVYAGDRNGNLWKIDISSVAQSNWKSVFGSVTSPTPLFKATDGSGTAQQITTGIAIAKHPNGGYFVMFGTGSWIDNTDPLSPFQSQSFYGIWDKDDGSTTVARSNLQRQTTLIYLDDSANICLPGTDGCGQIVSSCQPNYTSSNAASNVSSPLCPATVGGVALGYSGNTPPQLGWVFDMPQSGERVRSTAPNAAGNRVGFTTVTPASDPCTGNTIGLEYELNNQTGGATPAPVYLNSAGGYITINPTTNSAAAAALGYTGTTPLQVTASGKTLVGGASENPSDFQANAQSRPPGVGAKPAITCGGSAGTCSNYIPGWGFQANLNGGTSKIIQSCPPSATMLSCIQKNGYRQSGRLSWKQIIK